MVINYSALPGEHNSLAIWKDSQGYSFKERDGVAIDVTAPCSRPTATDLTLARCPAGGVSQVRVTLGDIGDIALVDNSAYPDDITTGQPFTHIEGGEGIDNLTGGVGPDELLGGDDGDTLFGGPGVDLLDGGPGPDYIQGVEGDDHIIGGIGDDLLRGGGGKDLIDGGEGTDQLRGGDGDDELHGGDGDDHLDFPGDAGVDESSGDDTLDGGAGNDFLYGGPASSEQRHEGDDTLLGGEGIDTADFSSRSTALTIDLDGAADDGERGERDNVEPDVENVLGGPRDDELTGSDAANLLDGGKGDDTLDGLAGDDVLRGGTDDTGGDNLIGGPGNDRLSGEGGDDSLSGEAGDDKLWGGGGTDDLNGGAGDDLAEGEGGSDVVDGGPGADIVNGGGIVLIGADGKDDLLGGSGPDILHGGRGDDTLDGGPGADEMHGDAGRDTVTYEQRTGAVTVTLNGQPDDGEKGEGDNVFPDVEEVLGGRVADTITGDEEANTVDGGRGQDLIDGGLGRDVLAGGEGADVVRARDGERDETITCGGGADLAILDDDDKAIECEVIDRPGSRRPTVGRSALVLPETPFELRLPDGPRFFPLEENVTIPLGSVVDPGDGAVRVATARNRARTRQVVTVSGGPFRLRQSAGRRPVTELRIVARPTGCGGAASGRRRRREPRVRTKTDKKKAGPVVAEGQHSRGYATGTEWITEDRCDGTLTTVISGTVRVHDFGRRGSVIVRPGAPHLAPARRED